MKSVSSCIRAAEAKAQNCPGTSHSGTLIFLKQIFPCAAEKWVGAHRYLEHVLVWGYQWGVTQLVQTNCRKTLHSMRHCFVRPNTLSAMNIRTVGCILGALLCQDIL